MLVPKTRISIRLNWKHPMWVVGLAFASGLLIGSYLPTQERLGQWIEAVSVWLSGPESRPIQKRQLGPVKRRQLDRLRGIVPSVGPSTSRPDAGAGGAAGDILAFGLISPP
jgi:hypothetical protein